MTAVAPPHPGLPDGLVDPGDRPDGPWVEAWRRLAATARHPNPFQGPELLLPALRHLAPVSTDGPGPVRLWTHPGPEPGSLDLVLPVATRRRWRRLPWPATVGWQHTHHFLGTPLVAPALGPEGWSDALEALAGSTPDAWLVLPGIDEDVARDVEAAAARTGRGVRRLAQDTRPVTLRRAQDDYLEQRLSGSRRKELRRCYRRLSDAVGGGLELVELVSLWGVEAATGAFLGLEAAGWKGADGGAVALDPAQQAWFAEATRAAADSGGLEVLALVGHDGAPAAIAVDLVTDRVRFTFKIAYDEQHAAWSPGLLLVMEELHRFHASTARLLDTCAVPGHPMATRLHPDGRTLVTLAVGLHGRRGSLAARSAPAVLAAGDRTRDRLHDVRRRVADRAGRRQHAAPTDTTTAPAPAPAPPTAPPTAPTPHPGGTAR